eukprot:TRINITY_DN18765_c0_g1_i1.p1 TRINITY_DN18765_c0_g1~~TRINITY_DN18765_c0_g1_i1.p1  ORF type:complete len:694 (+),score=119.13 TRINITY_DN18765_c0_g1_i1:168-2249(+)
MLEAPSTPPPRRRLRSRPSEEVSPRPREPSPRLFLSGHLRTSPNPRSWKSPGSPLAARDAEGDLSVSEDRTPSPVSLPRSLAPPPPFPCVASSAVAEKAARRNVGLPLQDDVTAVDRFSSKPPARGGAMVRDGHKPPSSFQAVRATRAAEPVQPWLSESKHSLASVDTTVPSTIWTRPSPSSTSSSASASSVSSSCTYSLEAPGSEETWLLPGDSESASSAVDEYRRPGPTTKAMLQDVRFGNVDAENALGLRTSLLDGRLQKPSPTDKVYWESFFVVYAVFCAYAALFGLQHEVKQRFGQADDGSAESESFNFAFSSLFVFNLIIRLGHRLIFFKLTPRTRVFVAMSALGLSMMILAVVICTLEWFQLSWVYLAYSLGGVGVGCFESNFLSTITPLGSATKRCAIAAIPVGVSSLLVLGFFLLGPPCYVDVRFLYLAVVGWLLIGMAIVAFRIPAIPLVPAEQQQQKQQDSSACGQEGDETGRAAMPLATRGDSYDAQVQKGEAPHLLQRACQLLSADWRQCRQWLPHFWTRPFASTLDMLCLSCFAPGCLLYVYDDPTVELLPGLRLQTHTYFALLNSFCMMGGVLGRCTGHKFGFRHPLVYSLVSLVGVGLVMLWDPLVALLGVSLVMLGDGLIYASMSHYIDLTIAKQHNLQAISYWLFIGDLGSVLGSCLIAPVQLLARRYMHHDAST